VFQNIRKIPYEVWLAMESGARLGQAVKLGEERQAFDK